MQVATIAWFEADSVCGSHSVAIPVVLVLPYLFRFFQCLRQYKDTGEKTTLLNGKYIGHFFYFSGCFLQFDDIFAEVSLPYMQQNLCLGDLGLL